MNLPAFLDDSPLPCTEGNPERYFPGPSVRLDKDAAAALCAGCPLLDGCLAYALAEPVAGVWGGTTEGQRERSANRAGRAYLPSLSGRVPSQTQEAAAMRRNRAEGAA